MIKDFVWACSENIHKLGARWVLKIRTLRRYKSRDIQGFESLVILDVQNSISFKINAILFHIDNLIYEIKIGV